jgi:hypothetical protein
MYGTDGAMDLWDQDSFWADLKNEQGFFGNGWESKPVDYVVDTFSNDEGVHLFCLSYCGWCGYAKDALNAAGIDFEAVNVDKAGDNMWPMIHAADAASGDSGYP